MDISEELIKLKEEISKLSNEELKERAEEKLKENKKDSVVEHKPRRIPKTDKVVKKGPLKDGKNKKVSNTKKTTKSNKEDKSK